MPGFGLVGFADRGFAARMRLHRARFVASLLVASSCVPRERSEQRDPAPPPAPSAAAPAGSPNTASPSALRARPVEAVTDDAASGDPLLREVFRDDFERGELGADWRVTGSGWSISEGRLCGQDARNHPVWLARRLPTNARIEFQASSASSDIKAELWGDGRSSATGQSYNDATSYLTIFGGWQNRFHVLARLDEHAPDRREIKLVPGEADFTRSTVVPQRVYQFQVERRDGRTVRWRVDGVELLTYNDAQPLLGAGHEHFGFNDWQARVCFDNLQVTPLQD
jgi:hypothetical protein